MLIAGIDLAAEPKGTALTLIEWTPGKAQVLDVQVNLDDEALIELAGTSHKLGIDCAFGWPKPFTDFVYQHNKFQATNFLGDMVSRRNLAYRETDRVTRALTGRWPLSVSTDRLGLTAMRCAGLLNRLEESGKKVSRAGFGDVVEIYPGASLRLWEFDTKDYRTAELARRALLTKVTERADWLDLGYFEEILIQSCDAFDSLVANLATRAVTLGKSNKPTGDQIDLAEVEGWIHLPTCSLEELAQ